MLNSHTLPRVLLTSTPYKKIIAAGVAAAIAVGGIGYGVSTGGFTSGGGGGETANIWVDVDGGTCVDNSSAVSYSSATACGGFDTANDAADNGDTIKVKGGTYAAQTITGGNSRTTRATLTIATGETATIDGSLQISVASFITLDGGGSRYGVGARLVTTLMGSDDNAAAPDNQWPGNINGSNQVTLQGADFGGWFILDSTNATVKFNDIGPCNNVDNSGVGSGSSMCDNGSVEYCEVAEIGCAGYNTDHLVEGNLVHDFNCDDSFFNGSGGDDCHWECMYVSYANNLTIRGNKFVNCANGGNIFHTFSNGGGSFTADFGYTGYTLENNVFTQSCNNVGSECGGRLDNASGFGHCNIYSGNDFTNTKIRFNSFLAGSGFDMDNACTMGSPGVTFTGNIRNGSSVACAGIWSVPPTFQYEVYHTYGTTCGGTGNTNIGGSPTFFTSDTNTAPDAHLTGAETQTPDNKVPTSATCPSEDFDGQTRPNDTNCDAGADER